MSQSTLVKAQLNAPLRSLALTVEEPSPGEFCWRILESHGAWKAHALPLSYVRNLLQNSRHPVCGR